MPPGKGPGLTPSQSRCRWRGSRRSWTGSGPRWHRYILEGGHTFTITVFDVFQRHLSRVARNQVPVQRVLHGEQLPVARFSAFVDRLWPAVARPLSKTLADAVVLAHKKHPPL